MGVDQFIDQLFDVTPPLLLPWALTRLALVAVPGPGHPLCKTLCPPLFFVRFSGFFHVLILNKNLMELPTRTSLAFFCSGALLQEIRAIPELPGQCPSSGITCIPPK